MLGWLKTGFLLLLIALGGAGFYNAVSIMSSPPEDLAVNCLDYPIECTKFAFSYTFLTPLVQIKGLWLPLPQESMIPILLMAIVISVIFHRIVKMRFFEKMIWFVIISIPISYALYYAFLYYVLYIPSAEIMGMGRIEAFEFLIKTSEIYTPYLYFIVLLTLLFGIPYGVKMVRQ